jgi:hypothetical protein
MNSLDLCEHGFSSARITRNYTNKKSNTILQLSTAALNAPSGSKP